MAAGSDLDKRDLLARSKRFSIDVIRFCEKLPYGRAYNTIANQLIRSATSVAANYRSARRGRSKAEFVAKLGIVVEEIDESEFWLDMIHELGWYTEPELLRLRKEAGELLAIFVRSRKTARGLT